MTTYSDPTGHIYLDFHCICRKKPLNAVCCTADFWQWFKRNSQDFPLISQNNSLAIMLCDRLCCLTCAVWTICLCSCKWDGWVRGTPRARGGNCTLCGHQLRRSKGRDFQRHGIWKAGESLYGAESSCSGDRENFLRTMFLKGFLRSVHSWLQKVTDGRNKAWQQGPACKKTMGKGSIWL